jgi:hypothetical protein
MLVQFGCGCIGVELVEGRQLIVESCYGDHDSPPLFLFVGNKINPENLPGTPVSEEVAERLMKDINRYIILGRRFEDVQRALGIEVTR